MPLPAPYAPPWKRLGEDGVALLAWLGLKVREVWRRNREGRLPLPAFWPRRWPQLFWPLVLAAVLLVGWLGVGAVRTPPGPAIVEGSAVEASDVEASDLGAADVEASEAAQPAERADGPRGTAATDLPAALEPPAGPDSQRDADSGRVVAFGEESGDPMALDAAPTTAPEPPESPAEREGRRLRAAWEADADTALISALQPEPASATLTLRFGEGLRTLGADQRQRLAERWRERAADAGYSHLRLREGDGRLWARDALVGRGMILLDPPGPADRAP
jgi:hypothetical protein